MSKRYVIRREEDIMRPAAAIRELIEAGKPADVIVRPYRRRRTVPQNDRMHALFRAIADYTGHSVDEVKAIMAERFLGTRQVAQLGIVRNVPRETSSLTVAEAGDFMEQVEAMCIDMGIPIEPT